MTLRRDIRLAFAKKESVGSRSATTDRYDRAIYHTSHQAFVMGGGNGVTYTLDGIANKVQQTPGIVGAGMPDILQIIQDFRSGTQTILSNRVAVTIDDGSLDNWSVGTGSSQNTQAIFTLNGDVNIYKVDQRISFSNDNYNGDETQGVDIFNFPGCNVVAQTANGTRVVCAHTAQIGSIGVGEDPNVAVNWDVIDNQPVTGTVIVQMAINDAGTLVVMACQRGEVITWQVGSATTTQLLPENNTFIDTQAEIGQPNLASVCYSSFWGGFILYSNNSKCGFVSESNPSECVGAMVLGFDTNDLAVASNQQNTTISAANPAGEIIVCTGFANHDLLLISPP
jgi:hypothetical protein